MKIKTIVLATVFAVASTAYASAASHRHHHRHHHMTSMSSGMGMGMGRSGPSRDGGLPDRSRAGGMGVSRNPE